MEPKRKPQDKPPAYNRSPQTQSIKDALKTSTQAIQKTTHENLTTFDWITVFAFMDEHLAMSQGQVAEHFKSKKDGALTFTQSSLSRRLKERAVIEARAVSYPNAMLSKRARIVTRPDVERALVIWINQMEDKGEAVSGPMLREKCIHFKNAFDVPEAERLTGDGWLSPFYAAYKIKQHRNHGEAGSVDPAAVEVERRRVAGVLSPFSPRDWWNLDKTSLNPL
jgi:hypothetical protein